MSVAGMEGAFAPLMGELDIWARDGKVAPLWLRDDDAVVPTPALDRLLACADRHGAALTLAVIPAFADEALAGRLATTRGVSVAVHGWAHANHAPAGMKKSELGGDRPADVVHGELAAGLDRINALFGAQALPLLVPPWNRISPAIVDGLAGLGYRALSVFGPEKPGAVRAINTHVDLIDWHGTRGGRPAGVLVAELVARLRLMRDEGRGACGFLTHHLVHDEAAAIFVEALLTATSAHSGCRWVPVTDVIDAA